MPIGASKFLSTYKPNEKPLPNVGSTGTFLDFENILQCTAENNFDTNGTYAFYVRAYERLAEYDTAFSTGLYADLPNSIQGDPRQAVVTVGDYYNFYSSNGRRNDQMRIRVGTDRIVISGGQNALYQNFKDLPIVSYTWGGQQREGWHHYTIQLDGHNTNLWIDGSPVTMTTHTWSANLVDYFTPIYQTYSKNMGIGAGGNFQDNYFMSTYRQSTYDEDLYGDRQPPQQDGWTIYTLFSRGFFDIANFLFYSGTNVSGATLYGQNYDSVSPPGTPTFFETFDHPISSTREDTSGAFDRKYKFWKAYGSTTSDIPPQNTPQIVSPTSRNESTFVKDDSLPTEEVE